MTEEDNVALVHRPPSSVETAGAGSNRIQSTMVADTLALARKQLSTPVAAKFRIGAYEWCEPDYRQILAWAKALSLSPEEVIECLLRGGRQTEGSWVETRFENGRLLKISWDADLLRLPELRLGHGLMTTHFAISAKAAWWGALELQLPHLTHLAFLVNASGPSLDLSGCPRLQWLDCSFSRISHLDLISAPNLIELYCVGNDIEELDLSPVPRLTRLNCMSGGVGCKVKGLKRLTMPRSPDLTYLECCYNSLSRLDLSGVPCLTYLGCNENHLEELDLSPVPRLVSLTCGANGLKRLMMPTLPSLTSLSCGSNSLSRLDLSGVPSLTFLDCSDNAIRELDLSRAPLLATLLCYSNPIRVLDLRPLHHLKYCGWKGLPGDSSQIQLIQRPDQHF